MADQTRKYHRLMPQIEEELQAMMKELFTETMNLD
jgi:hypothetical protein